jgi:hypothetical protein
MVAPGSCPDRAEKLSDLLNPTHSDYVHDVTVWEDVERMTDR